MSMRELPAAVQQAVKDQSRGATVRRLSKTVQDGQVEYEAQMTINGHGQDIDFDRDGLVIRVEEEVEFESLPVAARGAIQKAMGTDKPQKVKSVFEKGTLFFEATFHKAGKSTAIRVGADGAAIK